MTPPLTNPAHAGTVLVVGGTGLLGRRFITAALAAGYTIRCTLRGEAPAWLRACEGEQLDTMAWKGGDNPLPSDVWDGVESVVNLAGASIADGRWTSGRKQVLRDSRLATTRSIVQGMARQSHLRTLINASGVAIYGLHASGADEESPPQRDHFLAELAGDWEAEAQAAPQRVVLLRLGLVVAPSGGAMEKIVPRWLPRLTPLVPLGHGRQGVSWIHIDDAVAMILAAIANERWRGAVNAVAPEPVDNGHFTQVAAGVSGHPYIGIGVPRLALKAALGQQSALVLADSWVYPMRPKAWGFVHRYPHIHQALQAWWDERRHDATSTNAVQ
ncbi:MAG: TIGR01777 family protein [Planctomycetota bacterium]|nr:MAG: TIGR01777 family protein [Planctomycetota bacterium]